MKNLKKIIKNSLHETKKYTIWSLILSVVNSMFPFINIFGFGNIIIAIENGYDREHIIKIIVIFLSIDLFVYILKNILDLIDLLHLRIITDKMQYRYIVDSTKVDFPLIQSKKLLNLRRLSFAANPYSAYYSYLTGFIGNFFQLIFILFVLNINFSFLSLFLIIISILYIFITFKNSKIEVNYNKENVTYDRQISYIYDVMSNINFAKDVRINNYKKLLLEKFEEAEHKSLKNYNKKNKKLLFNGNVLIVLSTLCTIAIYAYYSYLVFNNDIGIGEYTIYISTGTLFLYSSIKMYNNVGKINYLCKSYESYDQYMNLVSENSTNHNSNNLEFNKAIDKVNIEFKNVSFSYDGKSNVLTNVSFKILEKSKTALVGLNGEGKTTIVSLICRLVKPNKGEILLNGVNINTIPYEYYLSKLCILLQDYFLFAFTIRENIIFDKELDLSGYYESLKKADIKVKIETFPLKDLTSYSKRLDNSGIEISGGESQKLLYARNLYKNGLFYILDEPTSALDPIAENSFYSKIKNDLADKTLLYISHRLSSTIMCDNILVLSNGQVLEQGTHEELMNNKGLYYLLFNEQAKYYKNGVKNEE